MINEIWEGLRLLPFFSSPKRGFYDGKRGLRILATRRPTPGHTMAPASAVSPRRPCRQAGPHGPPRRPGPGLSPLGVSLAAALWPSSGPKECGGMKIARLARAAPRRALAPGAGGCRGLVVWGRARRGPSPVCPGQFSPPPEARGAQPPRPGSRQSWGPGLGALRAARRAVWPFPPWRLCGRWGRFCRPGWGGQPLASPGPSPLGGL